MSICNACNVRLATEEALKDHYRSGFHQYNLKRRTQDFAPVSHADFQAMSAAAVAEQAAAAQAATPRVYICNACSRTFASEGQCESHLQSKKHAQRVRDILEERQKGTATAAAPTGEAGAPSAAAAGSAALPSPAAAEGGDSELVVSSAHCVFCFEESADVEANLQHMRSAHSFFVPDVEQLVDPEGLVTFLLSKVVEGRCIGCESAKQYESALAAQQHMLDKRHCVMLYEEERHFEEYAEFYDYDDGEEDEEGRVVDGRSGAGGVDINAGGDLELGSGRVARHRELLRYHNQRVSVRDERVSAQVGRLALEYHAAGVPTRMRPAEAAQLRAGVGLRGNRVDKFAQKQDRRYWQHLLLHTGILMNDIRRKHFRVAATGEGH